MRDPRVRRVRTAAAPARLARVVAIVALAASALALAQVTVVPTTLPAPQGGVPYSQTLVASGGAAPYSYLQMRGSLPEGLVLDPDAGTLSGTPVRAGDYDFAIFATDADGREAIVQVTGSVGSSVTLGPATLPAGVVGASYAAAFAAAGGTAPYVYTLASGALPPGLALQADGTLTGTPLTPGTFTFGVTATDAGGFTATVTRTITIGTPVSLASGALPPGVIGTPYSTTLAGSGGRAPYTYTLTGGTLPAGLALAADGTLAGTPLAAGTFPLTFTVTDQDGATGTGTRTLSIGGGVGLASAALPAATVGVAYATQLTGSGGTAPYTFAVVAGSLPAGLSLTSGGLVAGTPSSTGSFTITVRVTDANGFQGTGVRTLVVGAATPVAPANVAVPGPSGWALALLAALLALLTPVALRRR